MITIDNFDSYNSQVRYLNDQLYQYEKAASLIDDFIKRPNNEFKDVSDEVLASFTYTRFANVKDEEPVKNEKILINLDEIRHYKKFFDERISDIKGKLIVLYNQTSMMDPFN